MNMQLKEASEKFYRAVRGRHDPGMHGTPYIPPYISAS
jgi:hypothetical protein